MSPLEWAVSANGILFTAQIPIDASGQVVAGGIEAQALIYVTDREHLAAVNQVYAEYVTEPYPNRAAIIVSGFARAEMLVEIVAYAATSD